MGPFVITSNSPPGSYYANTAASIQKYSGSKATNLRKGRAQRAFTIQSPFGVCRCISDIPLSLPPFNPPSISQRACPSSHFPCDNSCLFAGFLPSILDASRNRHHRRNPERPPHSKAPFLHASDPDFSSAPNPNTSSYIAPGSLDYARGHCAGWLVIPHGTGLRNVILAQSSDSASLPSPGIICFDLREAA